MRRLFGCFRGCCRSLNKYSIITLQRPFANKRRADMLYENFDFDEFTKLADAIYDEICIWDADMRVVYINDACYRHYGLAPDYFIGKTVEELMEREKLWYPTDVYATLDNKKPSIQRQRTFLGFDITTISVPIFDSFNNVKYIVQSCREDEKNLFAELAPLHMKNQPEEGHSRNVLVYKSPAMQEVVDQADTVAKTKASVLILGETGTGKTLLARHIHEFSDRADKPFINVNMASLNPNLIESEFFGYEKGAFTGARAGGKKGLLEAANGGTLFLDEIGDFPTDLQAKFLSVLQDEEFVPVGGSEPIKLDIRIISATNCDIGNMVEAGKFRMDMYHRLNTIEITMPPLRKRPEDIPIMTSFYLKAFNEKYERHVEVCKEVLQLFRSYKWPGNIRELSNVIERGVITSKDGLIRTKDLPECFFSVDNLKRPADTPSEEAAPDLELGFDRLMEDYEGKIIRAAYEENPSSRRLAEALGISQTKASKLIRKFI